jgi:hypothetical protein
MITVGRPEKLPKLPRSEFNSTCTDCNRHFGRVDQYADHFVFRDGRVMCQTENEQYPFVQCPRCESIFRRHHIRYHWSEQAYPTKIKVPGRVHTTTYGKPVTLWYAKPCGPDDAPVTPVKERMNPPAAPAMIVEPATPWKMIFDLKDQLCDREEPIDEF